MNGWRNSLGGEVDVISKTTKAQTNSYDKTMKILAYPLLVQTASMVVRNAASLKSRYQLGVVQLKVREVPFSGAAKLI